MTRRDTEWVRRYWDRSADAYDRSMGLFERLMLGDGRRWIGRQAEGDVLEIAIGTGRNLPDYSLEARLTGIDLSPAMLRRARQRAVGIGREVRLFVGDAQKLDLPDGSFDTVVFSLALCSIPDDRVAISEAKRVLRPGGRLVLIEHVRSTRHSVRSAERLIDFFTSRLQGDHMLREPLDHLRREGFVIEFVARTRFGIIERTIARKPFVSSDRSGAASADAEVREVFEKIMKERPIGAGHVVDDLLSQGDLKDGLDRTAAADLVWVLNDAGLYHLLVHRRGWTPKRFRTWLSKTLKSQLLGASPPSASARRSRPTESG